MCIFRLLQYARTWAFKERGRRRITLTVMATGVAFLIGAFVVWERILVGVAVATLVLIAIQVVFGILDNREQLRAVDRPTPKGGGAQPTHHRTRVTPPGRRSGGALAH